MNRALSYINTESLYNILNDIIENNYSPTDDEKVF